MPIHDHRDAQRGSQKGLSQLSSSSRLDRAALARLRALCAAFRIPEPDPLADVQTAAVAVLRTSDGDVRVRSLVALTALTGRYPTESEVSVLQAWVAVGDTDRALRYLRRRAARTPRHSRERLPIQAPSLVVDLTRTSRATSITGIPRVARALAGEAQRRGGAPIIWSSGVPALARVADDGVIELERPRRRSHTVSARLVRALKRAYWRVLDGLGRTRHADRIAAAARAVFSPIGARLFDGGSPAHLLVLSDCHYVLPEVSIPATATRLLPWVHVSPGITLTVVVHDLLPLNSPRFFQPDQRVEHIEFSRVVCSAHNVIVASPHVRDEVLGLRALFGSVRHSPVQVTPYGGGFVQAWVDREGMVDRSSFLMIGSLDDRKNHATVLRALGWLAGNGRPTTLHMAGAHRPPSADTRQAIDYARSQGVSVVRHEGMSDAALQELAAQCSALFYPSFAEGYGLPVLEALAMGLPVLASDIPSNREHVALGGVVLFPVDDARAVADVVDRLITDDAWFAGLVTSIRRDAIPTGYDAWTAAVLDAAAAPSAPLR